MTSEESKLSKAQADSMQQTLDILHKPVQKGDYIGANTKAADLQKHFESLSPDMKKFMYNTLQSKLSSGVVDKEISGQFRYYLESGQRDKLLKTLNPDHQKDQIHRHTMNDAKAKAQKSLEVNMQGTAKQQELDKMMEQHNKAAGDIISKLRN